MAREPLANMLHHSNALHSFQIHNEEEHLILTLFTDDTTVYLKQSNDIGDVFQIIHK